MVGVAEAESVLVALCVTIVDVCRMDMKRMVYSAADCSTYQSPQFSGNDTFLGSPKLLRVARFSRSSNTLDKIN